MKISNAYSQSRISNIFYRLFLYFREGLGSFYGTLSGPILDPDPSKAKYREKAKAEHEKSNFKVNPPKKGTGYGYVMKIRYGILLNGFVCIIVIRT